MGNRRIKPPGMLGSSSRCTTAGGENTSGFQVDQCQAVDGGVEPGQASDERHCLGKLLSREQGREVHKVG